jgi:hypothetical protein
MIMPFTTMINFFLLCLPLFIAITGGLILLQSFGDCIGKEYMLKRELLFYFLAVLGTWSGLLVYYHFTAIFPVFFPFHSFCALCVPVCLYRIIYRLTGEKATGLLSVHFLLPLLCATLAATVAVYAPASVMSLEREWLTAIRLLSSLIYFGLTVHLRTGITAS